jgi:hypothetical protein
MAEPVSIETLYEVARTIRDQKIVYTFVGGLALNAWAIPRATFDLDMAIVLPAERQRELLRSLGRIGWSFDPVFEGGWRDSMAGIPIINAQIPAEGAFLRVDLMIAETDFLQSVIARRVDIDLGEGPLPVCSAADLLLFKLLAWRAKDRMDIDNLIWMQGLPDRSYVEEWAARLGVVERLREALAET